MRLERTFASWRILASLRETLPSATSTGVSRKDAKIRQDAKKSSTRSSIRMLLQLDSQSIPPDDHLAGILAFQLSLELGFIYIEIKVSDD